MEVAKKKVEGHVTVQSKNAVLSEETIQVGESITTGPTANVGFAATYTKNLGNYESLKLTVSLFYPVAVSAEGWEPQKVTNAMEEIQKWVDETMGKTIASLDEK